MFREALLVKNQAESGPFSRHTFNGQSASVKVHYLPGKA